MQTFELRVQETSTSRSGVSSISVQVQPGPTVTFAATPVNSSAGGLVEYYLAVEAFSDVQDSTPFLYRFSEVAEDGDGAQTLISDWSFASYTYGECVPSLLMSAWHRVVFVRMWRIDDASWASLKEAAQKLYALHMYLDTSFKAIW